MGGVLTAAAGQIILSDSAPYDCLGSKNQCWGTVSVSEGPPEHTIEVIATGGIVVSSELHVGLDGSFNGNAEIPCAFNYLGQFQATVVGTEMESGFVAGNC